MVTRRKLDLLVKHFKDGQHGESEARILGEHLDDIISSSSEDLTHQELLDLILTSLNEIVGNAVFIKDVINGRTVSHENT